jgi:hypothetical protein
MKNRSAYAVRTIVPSLLKEKDTTARFAVNLKRKACGVVLKTDANMMCVTLASTKSKLNVPTTTCWSLISLNSSAVTVTPVNIHAWFARVQIVISLFA